MDSPHFPAHDDSGADGSRTTRHGGFEALPSVLWRWNHPSAPGQRQGPAAWGARARTSPVPSGLTSQDPAEWLRLLGSREVATVALRFNGRKLDRLHCPIGGNRYDGLREIYESKFRDRLSLHAEPIVNWGSLYWLERCLNGGRLTRFQALQLGRLFVLLHDSPVPDGFQVSAYHQDYLQMVDRIRSLATSLADAVEREARKWRTGPQPPRDPGGSGQ